MIKNKLIAFVFIIFGYSFSLKNHIDYVPNKETAIKIAEAVWLPIYGKEIYTKQPFIAVLNETNSWHVYGTSPTSAIKIDSNGDSTITIVNGGIPHILINKSDGKILNVYHTK